MKKAAMSSILIVVVLFTLALIAEAQQSAKLPRIGYITTSDDAGTGSARFDGIRQGLRELGYIEGRNIAIEHRIGGMKLDRYHEVVGELVRLKVDVIVVGGGTTYVQVVKKATKSIPIVMTGPGGDPVKAGLIESLARPGGNVTGITILARDLGGKRLELFKEALPEVARVAILYDPANPSHQYELKEVLPGPARALQLMLQPWEVRASADFEKAFAAIAKQRPDGLYALGGPLMIANQKRIVDFALKSRLPSVYSSRENVEAGGLMSYGTDLSDSYRRVAIYVDRILKGAKPADLPVEQPTKFEFVINLKTAKALNLTIPQSVLYRADKVIK